MDPTNGYRVQRSGTVGEPDGVNPGFQTPGDNGIVIPFGATIPGQPTADVELSGNLTADATGPQAEVLTSATPFSVGGAAATAATTLNALDSNTVDYVLGDSVIINGADVDGSPINVPLAVDGTTTLGDLAAAVSGAYAGATASVDASGNLVLTADNDGDSQLVLSISDDVANTGGTNFANHTPNVQTPGKFWRHREKRGRDLRRPRWLSHGESAVPEARQRRLGHDGNH